MDESSRLSSIGGVEDVELNFFGSGRGDFQAFFKPASYSDGLSQSGAQSPNLKPASDHDSAQFSWGGGGSDGGCCGPVQMSGVPAFNAPLDSSPDKDSVLNKILAPNGGVQFTAANDTAPDPTPEPAYSALLALGAGLLIFARLRSSNRPSTP
jgi:hypothetical protein